MGRLLSLAGIAFFALCGGAFAAPCQGTGSPAAKVLTFSPDDSKVVAALTQALQTGFSPASFPSENIEATSAPCKRMDFQADVTYALYGNDADSPPRWATSARTPGLIVFLASIPYSGATPRPGAGAIYVLAATFGNVRRIFRFYDAIPTDQRLVLDICTGLTGESPIIATYYALTGSSDLGDIGLVMAPFSHSRCQAGAQ